MSGKIYITGTRGGLGSAIMSKLTLTYPYQDIIELNRPEHDLSRVDGNLDSLVKDDFSIYVNCSHYEFSQVELLYRLFDHNKNRKCHIINIGSVAGSYPYPGGNVYGGTKAFVSQFSLNLRADLVSKGINVTSIEPGLAETEFSLVRFKGDNEKANKVYENTNFIKPEDIGETIYWVATRPKNINVNRIEIMAGLQAFNPFNIIKK